MRAFPTLQVFKTRHPFDRPALYAIEGTGIANRHALLFHRTLRVTYSSANGYAHLIPLIGTTGGEEGTHALFAFATATGRDIRCSLTAISRQCAQLGFGADLWIRALAARPAVLVHSAGFARAGPKAVGRYYTKSFLAFPSTRTALVILANHRARLLGVRPYRGTNTRGALPA